MLRVKKYWFIYAILLLLVVTGILAWGIWQKTRFDRSSRAAVTETIEAVLFNDLYAPLIDAAFNASINERPAARFSNYLTATKQTLGTLNAVLGVYGEAQVPLLNFGSTPIIANYEVDLEFSRGPATLKYTMHYYDGQWQTSMFLIDSTLLLN